METNNMERDNSAVQVAVRIRPLVDSEISRGCRDILEVFPAIQQIRLKDSDKAFTYNHIFDTQTSQDQFYNTCIKHMISNIFEGYNLTILAYGQTGSGKTYSMGTTYNGQGEMGAIPRAVNEIFAYVNDNFTYDFTVTVSFMELYQETLYDLLANKPRDQCVVEIREDLKGIIIPGLTEQPVTSAASTLECLVKGSQGRATGCTNMNSQSSRSHAIFTLNICMQRKDNSNLNKTAKFHLVDLAGSERSKKTGATGVTFREGVHINKGLLALGNVISALGDEKQQGYIGYRDSNLTRLLKDSLGGNSITLMIACVSPADYNFDETLSTLRYADRAKKIKNKPIINQDPKAAEINRLNKLVQQLRLELVGQGGPIICQAELSQLTTENTTLKKKNRQLTLQLSATLNENTGLFERLMLMRSANERMTKKLVDLKEEYNITINNLNISVEQNNVGAIKEHVSKLHGMQNILTDIDSEMQKNEEEIRKHERCGSATNIANVDLASESEVSEKQESHTKQQIALNCELQELTKMLAMKEHLAQQMQANTYHMVDYNAISENETKILALEKEKDELLQQLKSAQSVGVSSKIAEQRRKRVQELEKEIHELHKKVTEQARLIKLKEKDEQKIRQLNNEIQQMKIAKVRLIKNMKQESEKFRTWKIQRERDLIKLKEQDRKRQNQLVKMETMHSRQQNVLKRKVEEAAAINKRLKDALALRKTVHDQKNSGKIERLGPWIQQELDIFVSTVDAEATLSMLIEDRATLTKQLDQLKANPELADPLAMKQIEDEIDIRSVQIQDLQQKILDSDQDNKANTRWENVQSMGEAKYCLKALFELTADIRRKEAVNEAKLNELHNILTETTRRLNEQDNQIKCMKSVHADELSNMAKEYEEKISVLLRQLRGIPVQDDVSVEEEFQNRYNIQSKALEQAEILVEQTNEELQKVKINSRKNEDLLKQEIETLKETIDEIRLCASDAPATPQPCRGKRTTVKEQTFEHDSSFEDDPDADPDWKKTPLGKRIQKMRNESKIIQAHGDRLTVKRGSDGGCACRGNCTKRSCGCKKFSKSCSNLCKCSHDVCQNKSIDKENSAEIEDEQKSTTEDEDSFKRPRPLQEDSGNVSFRPKQLRQKKTLFGPIKRSN